MAARLSLDLPVHWNPYGWHPEAEMPRRGLCLASDRSAWWPDRDPRTMLQADAARAVLPPYAARAAQPPAQAARRFQLCWRTCATGPGCAVCPNQCDQAPPGSNGKADRWAVVLVPGPGFGPFVVGWRDEGQDRDFTGPGCRPRGVRRCGRSCGRAGCGFAVAVGDGVWLARRAVRWHGVRA